MSEEENENLESSKNSEELTKAKERIQILEQNIAVSDLATYRTLKLQKMEESNENQKSMEKMIKQEIVKLGRLIEDKLG